MYTHIYSAAGRRQKQRWANFKTLALKKKVKIVAGKREPENKVSCVRCASLKIYLPPFFLFFLLCCCFLSSRHLSRCLLCSALLYSLYDWNTTLISSSTSGTAACLPHSHFHRLCASAREPSDAIQSPSVTSSDPPTDRIERVKKESQSNNQAILPRRCTLRGTLTHSLTLSSRATNRAHSRTRNGNLF